MLKLFIEHVLIKHEFVRKVSYLIRLIVVSASKIPLSYVETNNYF